MFVWRLESEQSAVLSDGYNNTIRFFPDGRLAATSDDGIVLLVDPKESKNRRSFNAGYGTYTDVALSPDGKRIVLPAWNGVLQIWDLESNRQIAALPACDHRSLSCSAAFLDENTLASVFDNELRIWRAPAFTEIEKAETARVNVLRKEDE